MVLKSVSGPKAAKPSRSPSLTGPRFHSSSRSQTAQLASKLHASGQGYHLVRNGQYQGYFPSPTGPVRHLLAASSQGSSSPASSVRPARRTGVGTPGAGTAGSAGGHSETLRFSDHVRRFHTGGLSFPFADPQGNLLDTFTDPYGNDIFEVKGLSRELPEALGAAEALVYAPDYWRGIGRQFYEEFPVLTAAGVGSAGAIAAGATASGVSSTIRHGASAARAVGRGVGTAYQNTRRVLGRGGLPRGGQKVHHAPFPFM